MRALLPSVAIFAVAAFFAPAASGAGPDHTTEVAKQVIEWINAGDYASIQSKFNQGMNAALPLDKSSTFFKGLTQQMGKVQQLGEPRSMGGVTLFPAKFEKGILDLQIVLDSHGLIAGLSFKPHVANRAQTHETRLSLPFKGRWLVFWGGNTRELNQHHDVPNQRLLVLDLLGVDNSGKTRRGDGTHNEDYYAFGREVLAPADGTVLEVIDGVRDNAPGSMNSYSALGNCVIIQHRQEEVSVLAHLKLGTIVVKPGNNVKRGQLLGKCGNSGNSSEPHLHYHLQNSPILQDGIGVQCSFQKVVVIKDGTTDTPINFSPVKGDIISPQ